MWSKKFSECISCNSNKGKHHGHGLCRYCYNEKQMKDPVKRAKANERSRLSMRKNFNPEKNKVRCHIYYLKNGETRTNRTYKPKNRRQKDIANILTSVRNGRIPTDTNQLKTQINILKDEINKMGVTK